MDNLIVFNNEKFIDYSEEIFLSEPNVEKANRLGDQANYLNLTFIATTDFKQLSQLKLSVLVKYIPSAPSYDVDISQLIRYAAHIMLPLDITQGIYWTDSFLRVIKSID